MGGIRCEGQRKRKREIRDTKFAGLDPLACRPEAFFWNSKLAPLLNTLAQATHMDAIEAAKHAAPNILAEYVQILP